MLLKILLFFTITFLLIQACDVAPTDNERKIIGTWTIEEVENPNPNSLLHTGFLISFTKDKIFQPRNGTWKITEDNNITYLLITSSLEDVSRKYKVYFQNQGDQRPYEIYIQAVDSTKESYHLGRIEDDLNNF